MMKLKIGNLMTVRVNICKNKVTKKTCQNMMVL